MSRIATLDGIPRRYLHDEVAERLRDLILSGELEPGARVNELALCERFGISRTPLREAIKILSAEGILDLLPNRGARVAFVSESEIEEMTEVIAGLEAVAGDLACRHITPEELAAIRVDHAAMVEAWKTRDERGYFERNRAIHEAIVRAARNGTLQTLYASLSSRIQRLRYTAHKTDAQWSRAIGEHEEMLRLLDARNGDALGRLLRDHIRGKKVVIAAAYGRGEAS